MSKVKVLKAGSILSESSFYEVISLEKGGEAVRVKELRSGQDGILLSAKYVEDLTDSASYYEDVVPVTRTEMVELLMKNTNVACSISFTKKATTKSKRAYNAEIASAVKRVQSSPAKKRSEVITELLENPITREVPGETRVMVGHHDGTMNQSGRLVVYDLEEGGIPKQVDPRTMFEYICRGVKYIIK